MTQEQLYRRMTLIRETHAHLRHVERIAAAVGLPNVARECGRLADRWAAEFPETTGTKANLTHAARSGP